MSSEVHKYIETALDSKKDLFEAEVIDFPNNKKIENFDNWKLNNKSNILDDEDQLKAVTGICFIFSILIILGLYSYFL
ncbi:hypothetical protein OA339_02175 [Candidatus Pelagibacter sp.]|nr:hypothetical protein [Candidatus Pelagibacter sp.]|tara:strand:+ start:230 stop:463 length:234 start_codon:yes stop_codon:yes gene_type:complete